MSLGIPWGVRGGWEIPPQGARGGDHEVVLPRTPCTDRYRISALSLYFIATGINTLLRIARMLCILLVVAELFGLVKHYISAILCAAHRELSANYG